MFKEPILKFEFWLPETKALCLPMLTKPEGLNKSYGSYYHPKIYKSKNVITRALRNSQKMQILLLRQQSLGFGWLTKP